LVVLATVAFPESAAISRHGYATCPDVVLQSGGLRAKNDRVPEQAALLSQPIRKLPAPASMEIATLPVETAIRFRVCNAAS
jgi:hypothetical protein